MEEIFYGGYSERHKRFCTYAALEGADCMLLLTEWNETRILSSAENQKNGNFLISSKNFLIFLLLISKSL